MTTEVTRLIAEATSIMVVAIRCDSLQRRPRTASCSSTMRRVLAVCAYVVALASCATDRTRRGYLRANAATIGKPARPAIVIAGFGITRLVDPVTKRHVWGTPSTMWRTRYDDDRALRK